MITPPEHSPGALSFWEGLAGVGYSNLLTEAESGHHRRSVEATATLDPDGGHRARRKGSQAAAAARRQQARDAYAYLIPTMLELQAAGRSLAQIAADLNDQGHKARRARRWSKTQVKRVLDRIRLARLQQASQGPPM